MKTDILVDFNSIDDRHWIFALVEDAADPALIKPGTRLIAGDEGANQCVAVVREVSDSGLVALELDMRTFVTPKSRTLASAG